MPVCTKPDCKYKGEELPPDLFYKRAAKRNGLSSWCKDCYAGTQKTDRQKRQRPADISFAEQARRYNLEHPTIRFGELRERLNYRKGDTERTVVV